VRLALLLGEFEQVHRAFDVHLVRGDGSELAARRQVGREVIDVIDIELGEDAVQRGGVGDGPDDLRWTILPRAGSSARTSSVTMVVEPSAARRVMSPWPISPLAPVISTPGRLTMNLSG